MIYYTVSHLQISHDNLFCGSEDVDSEVEQHIAIHRARNNQEGNVAMKRIEMNNSGKG